MRQFAPDGSRRGDPQAVETDLSTGLAMAYLADEEAAVDEWKHWVARLWQRLLAPGR